jgi:hypothetical protein
MAQRADGLILALLGTALSVLSGFIFLRSKGPAPGRMLRWALLAISGGMGGYILYLLLLPDTWRLPLLAVATAFVGGLSAALALSVYLRTGSIAPRGQGPSELGGTGTRP